VPQPDPFRLCTYPRHGRPGLKDGIHASLARRVDVIVQENPVETQLLSILSHLYHTLIGLSGSDVISELHA